MAADTGLASGDEIDGTPGLSTTGMKGWSAILVNALALTLINVLPANAQQARIPRIGYLRPNEVPPYGDAFRKGLRGLTIPGTISIPADRVLE